MLIFLDLVANVLINSEISLAASMSSIALVQMQWDE
jgi:hypothetical protein